MNQGEDEPRVDKRSSLEQRESDLEMLERLFNKVHQQHNIDKNLLFRKLTEPQSLTPHHHHEKILKTENRRNQILQGISGRPNGQTVPDGSSMEEEISIERFSGEMDFLMDENILTNESREEEGKRQIKTPNIVKQN